MRSSSRAATAGTSDDSGRSSVGTFWSATRKQSSICVCIACFGATKETDRKKIQFDNAK